MVEFKNRQGNRLKGYDYSLNGYYFVTVCTYKHREMFGEINSGCMAINKSGEIVQNTWIEIPNHFDNVELDEFIVMPNHIHGIIKIDDFVGTGHALSSNSLSDIVGAFKSAVTKHVNRSGNVKFRWQRSFYDHIIRDERSLNDIREYVANNPKNWDFDENNIKNIFIEGKACLAPTENL